MSDWDSLLDNTGYQGDLTENDDVTIVEGMIDALETKV